MLLIYIIFVFGANAFYEKGTDVLAVTNTVTAQTIIASKLIVFLEIYREGCGYCRLLTPEYEKVATNLRKMVTIAAVDAEKNRDVASLIIEKYGIDVKGVPTIILLKPNEGKLHFILRFVLLILTSVNKHFSTIAIVINLLDGSKEVIPYNGERKSAPMINFIVSHIPNYVSRIGTKKNDARVYPTFEDFMQKNAKTVNVVIFSNKPAASTLAKALSTKYHGKKERKVKNHPKLIITR